MNPWIPRLLLLQIPCSLLAGLRETLPGCGSCGGIVDPLHVSLGLAGAAAYFLLWRIARTRVSDRRLALGVGAATGIHAGLFFHMLQGGTWCLWCLLAAAGAAGVSAILLRTKPARPPLLFAGAATALLISAPLLLAAAPPPAYGPVRITVYERTECAYCWELKLEILPALMREFGGALRIDYRPAGEAPWIRRTPTLVFEDDLRPEIIEGMPSGSFLRKRILARRPRAGERP